jgi:hypothetical protein
MPIYRVKDSQTGVSLNLTGDSPPTEQELETIFSEYSAGNQQNASPSIGRMAVDMGTEVGGAIAGQALGAPLAPVTFGLSIPVGGAIGGGIANTLVQRGQIERGEREDFSFGELTAATLLSAIPGGKAIKGGTTIGRTIAKRAIQGSGISVGSDLAKTLIDEGRAPNQNELISALAIGAVTGGGLGGVESAVSKYGKNALSGIKEYGAIKEFVPALRKIAGLQSSLAAEGEFAIKDLNKSLNKIKDKDQRKNASDLLLMYLKGQTHITNVPQEIAPQAKLVRSVIAAAGERATASGMVEGNIALENKITDNLGSYLTRQYKIFNGWRPDNETISNWIDVNLQDRIKTETQKALRRRLVRAQRLQDLGMKNPKMQTLDDIKKKIVAKTSKWKQEYTDAANSLLDVEGARQWTTGGKLNAKSSVYRRRSNIDPLTRELLGEIHDPIYLASETLNKMTASEAKFKALTEVKKIGIDSGIFRTKSIVSDVEMTSPDKPLNPLSKLWANPEIKNAFDSYLSTDIDPIMQKFGAIASISSILKLPKTLGSLKGWASNVWGGAMDTLAQGHGLEFLRSKNYRQAMDNTLFNFGLMNPNGSLKSKESFEIYKFFKQEGLLRGNIQFNDFKRGLLESDKSILNKLPDQLKNKIKGSIETTGKMYSTPESAAKVFNFFGELKALNKAYPSRELNKNMMEAANNVRLTTQDYDSLPKFLRNFSSIGFLDPFVSYTADRFRVVFNTYKLGLKEIATKNPVLVSRGSKRIASMTTVLGGVGYIGSNVGLDSEEEKAVRNRMAPWDRDGLVSIQKNDNGTYSYTNMNYMFPHSTAIEAASLAMKQASPEEAFSALSRSLSSQLFGSNLLLGPLSEVVTGKTAYGTPITSENASLYKQFSDKSKYFLDSTLNPLVVRETNKFFKTLKANDYRVETASGNIYTMDDLIKENLLGIRKKTINPESRLRIDSLVLNKSIINDKISYSSARKRAMDDAEKQSAYDNYISLDQEAFGKAKQLVADARALGMDDEDTALTLKSGGLPSKVILGAITDTYIPPSIDSDKSSDDLVDKIMMLPVNRRSSEISAISKEDPGLARTVSNRVKSQMRDLALGVNEIDRLVGSLDANDGTRAMYFAKQYMKLQSQQERELYINSLKSKRLLTPLVYEQLKAYLVSQ